MQATVRSFDPERGSGTLLADDGTGLEFGAAVFAGSGLRLLRPGQRVSIRLGAGGAVAALALVTFPLPGA
jgi:2-phospho-L-lactate guanylyltransferase